MIALWLFNSLLWNITILRTDTPSCLLSMKRVFSWTWRTCCLDSSFTPNHLRSLSLKLGILQIKEQRASQPSKNWMFSQKLSDKPILLKNNIKTSLFKDSMDLHCLCSPFYCASSGDSSATLQRKGSRIARKFRLALYRGVSNGESKQHTWWVRSTHLKKLNQLGIIPNSVIYLKRSKPPKQLNQNMSGEPLSSGMLIRGDRINSRIQTATLRGV